MASGHVKVRVISLRSLSFDILIIYFSRSDFFCFSDALILYLTTFDFASCSVVVRLSHSRCTSKAGERNWVISINPMTTEIRNWAVVAALMEAQGPINSQM